MLYGFAMGVGLGIDTAVKDAIKVGLIITLASFLDPALPPAVFTLPPEFAAASWRAEQSDGRYTARGTTQGTRPNATEATLVLEAATGRLSSLTLGSAERDLHAEVRVSDIVPATLDRAALETTLNQAIVVGSVDRSDASLQDYVQDEAFFVVRYPRRNWRAGRWDAALQQVKFTNACGAPEGCPALAVSVYDLTEGKGPRQYAEDLGSSLGLQPEYQKIKVSTTTIGYPPPGYPPAGDQTVGAGGYPVVEYFFVPTPGGKVEITHHIEYIFVGQLSRYHLDFTAPPNQFEANRDSFEAIAAGFTYLR